MPIPPFDKRGLLPPGKHSASLGEFRRVLAYNDRRCELCSKLEQFVATELSHCAQGLSLTVGGSYLTDKPYPGDIETSLGLDLVNISSYAPALIDMANNFQQEHNRIKLQYEVDFYIYINGMGNQFDMFFQYVGPKTASAKGLDSLDSRGILEVII